MKVNHEADASNSNSHSDIALRDIRNETQTQSPNSRRMNKQVMERRRRARINACLEQIKEMVLQGLHKDPSEFEKLEKADILEMTVTYLEKQKSKTKDSELPTSFTTHHVVESEKKKASIPSSIIDSSGSSSGSATSFTAENSSPNQSNTTFNIYHSTPNTGAMKPPVYRPVPFYDLNQPKRLFSYPQYSMAYNVANKIEMAQSNLPTTPSYVHTDRHKLQQKSTNNLWRPW